MLQAVKLPASVTNLATGLANMDRDTFTHFDEVGFFVGWLERLEEELLIARNSVLRVRNYLS